MPAPQQQTTPPHYKATIIEGFRDFSHRIFSLAHQGVLRIDFLREASKILMDYIKCDTVELYVLEREKYYHAMLSRSPERPFQCQIIPHTRNENGRAIPEPDHPWDLDRLCQDMIHGHIDLPSNFFTGRGSFWTGDISQPVQFTCDQGRYSRRYDLSGNDQSLVLIPFEIERGNVGLIQLRSSKRNFFTTDTIEFCEGLTHTLGVALIDRRAQVDLRERVKELTCLYGIARLVAQPDLSLEQILQGIVELLPPAWLFPEIASARLILNDRTYATPQFPENTIRQSAPVVVNGQRLGVIEVAYSEEKPELDEGPFLREERHLIEAVAREIAHVVEQKQAEKMQAKLQEQLKHADRLATIGQLAAGVAHELNEPLGNVLGFAQLILKDAELSEQIRHDIERIEKASLHAREVIRKLMTFARQKPPEKRLLDINKLVTEGLTFIESRCAKEGIVLQRSLSSGIPEIIADQSQLQQVLINLVVNAIQAMPEGGTLTITTQRDDRHVLLIVEDTGIGMSKETLDQIWIPFFTTKGVGQGTGLGLAVVHGIVTSHGGTVDVKSSTGKGSRFEVRLPIGDTLDFQGGE